MNQTLACHNLFASIGSCHLLHPTPTGLPAIFDSSNGPTVFYHYDCTGDELSLTECPRLPLVSSCSLGSDAAAGVRCTGKLKKAGINLTSIIISVNYKHVWGLLAQLVQQYDTQLTFSVSKCIQTVH